MPEYNMLFAYLIGIVVLFLLGRLLIVPIKFALKVIYHLAIGVVVLIAINFIGKYYNFQISLNGLTALITGTLGLPGLVMIVLLKKFF